MMASIIWDINKGCDYIEYSTTRMNVRTDIPYILSQYIREYDISKCNINMMYLKNMIDKQLYDWLNSADKQFREIYVGNMIKKDPSYYKAIKEGIIDYRNRLFKENNIQEEDIVSIRSDAVFIANKILDKTKFDDFVEFKNKNTYTSFFKIKNLDIYYNVNTDIIHIKGINDNILNKHNYYMLDFIKTVIYLIEMNDYINASLIIKDLYIKFITRDKSLDLGYYRTFDSYSIFKINDISGFTFDVPIDDNPNNYDVSTNINILMEFNKVVLSLIMSNNRRLL